MAGAYTAKSGANYSMEVSGPSSQLAGDSAAVVGSFRLNGYSRTIEPANLTITWTATIGGSAVNLRVVGGSYASSATSTAADSGTYWQSSVSLEFEDIGAATDRTLVITAAGTVDSMAVSGTVSYTIADYMLNVTGPTTMGFNAAAACVASFRADATSKTAEPTNKTITWSATLDGNPVNLRVGSSGGYAATATDTASDSGTFWEASSSLEFDMSVDVNDRTLVVTGAGTIAGLAVNDTATTTVEGWPDAEYTYTADLEDVFWVSGLYHWELRCSVAIREVSGDALVWFKRWYKRQLKSDGSIDEGVVSETNPPNDPGDITFSSTDTVSAIGAGPNFYIDDMLAALTMKVGAQNPLYYYRFIGEVVLARTSTGTNVVTQIATVRSITTGVVRATNSDTGTYTQTSADGELKVEDNVITELAWNL
ncbi:MAG: hypothetical protein V3T88_00985 [Nitrosomonadaceae bacterium]